MTDVTPPDPGRGDDGFSHGFGDDFDGILDAEVVASTSRSAVTSAGDPAEATAFGAPAEAGEAPSAAGESDGGIPGPAAAVAHRTAVIERITGETSVRVELDIDGVGNAKIATGIGFFDHMLHQIAKHGRFDLAVETIGDLHVDAHHTVEDTTLAFGAALAAALGDKRGIRRFGDAVVPLDEVLVQAAVDLSGRPYVVHDEPPLAPYVGPIYPTSMTRHVWESLGHAARLTLHVTVLRAARPGSTPDAHHVVEAQCKAVARALRDAVRRDAGSGVPSTKGVL
jgi:imidazoleglycerol-phosphate dehydratase